MCAFPKGIIIGSPYGQFAIWVKTTKDYSQKEIEDGEDQLFYPIRIWNTEKPKIVHCLNYEPRDSNICLSFADNDIATFNLS